MQREILVVLDLVLEQDQDHAHCNHVLGQVPNLAFEMEAGKKRAHGWRDGKNVCPGRESQHGDESPRRGAPIRIPEVNAASQVNGEEDRIQSQVETVARPVLDRQKKDGKRSVKQHQPPAKMMVELAYVQKRNG